MGLGTRTRNLRRPRELNRGLIKAESHHGSSRARRKERGGRRGSFGLRESQERSSTWDATKKRRCLCYARGKESAKLYVGLDTLSQIAWEIYRLSAAGLRLGWSSPKSTAATKTQGRIKEHFLLSLLQKAHGVPRAAGFSADQAPGERTHGKSPAEGRVSRKKSSGRKRRRTSSKL